MWNNTHNNIQGIGTREFKGRLHNELSSQTRRWNGEWNENEMTMNDNVKQVIY